MGERESKGWDGRERERVERERDNFREREI